MQTKSETNPIEALECYDSITSSKKTELDTSYCPFNIESGDFAWINEKDQFSIFPNSKFHKFILICILIFRLYFSIRR